MFFVTGITDVELSEYGWPTHDTRCFGYYKKLKDAVDAVINNKCDINEQTYDYVVIEKIEQGVHIISRDEYWYKYNKEDDKYFKIDKPSNLNDFCNFAIG